MGAVLFNPRAAFRSPFISWFMAAFFVIASHGGVWFSYTSWAGQPNAQPLPAVQITLISMPPLQESKPASPSQRPPAAATPQHIATSKPSTPVPATTNSVAEEPDATDENSEHAPPVAQEEFSQPLYNAAYLNNPPPVYPLAARRRGIEGTVVVRAQIQDNGHCLQAQLSKSSGHELLDKAAVNAVRSWRFIPAKRGSQTITAWVEVPITFRLTHQDEQT